MAIRSVTRPEVHAGKGGNGSKNACMIFDVNCLIRPMLENSGHIILRARYRPVLALEYVSQNVTATLGYTPEELVADPGLVSPFFPTAEPKPAPTGSPADSPRYLVSPWKAKDGHTVWLGQVFLIERDGQGEPESCLIVARDITRHKLAEEAFLMEKSWLHSLTSTTTDAITVLDRDFNIIFQNEPAKLNSNGSRFGEKCYRVHEKREDICEGCPVAQAFRDGKPHTTVRKRILPGGEVTFWENTANPIRDPGGEILTCLEIGRNITEHYRLAQALDESRQFTESLLQNSPTAVIVINPDTSIRYVNSTWERINGWKREEVIGMKAPYPWWPEESKEASFREFRAALSQPTGRCASIAVKKNGERYWLDVHWVSVMRNGEVQYVILNAVDITEQIRAFEQVKLLSSVTEQVSDAIMITDSRLRITYMNRAAEEHLGYSFEEIRGRSLAEFHVNPPDEKTIASAKETVRQGRVWQQIIPKRRKDGRIIICDCRLCPLHDETGRISAYINAERDITRRMQIEAKLQAQNQLIESILATTPQGILVLDGNDRIILANDAACRVLHRRRSSVPGKTLREVIPVAALRRTLAEIRAGRSARSALEFRRRYRGADKIITASILKMGEERILITLTDITQEREREEKLYLTDRLASLGEMAAGITHELNNPITAILSLAQLLLKSDIGGEYAEDIKYIYEEARHAAEVVKNVLLLTRSGNGTGRASVNEVVGDVLKLRRYQQKLANIAVTTSLGEDLPPVRIDRFQLQQVFLNIILNAEAAIKEAGRPGVIEIATSRANDHVATSFTDNGCGIKKHILPRIFDPFFTTKEVGKGTGLGLSVCYSIISRHGGRISVRTRAGKGSTFTVMLPVAAEGEDGTPMAGKSLPATVSPRHR